MVHPDDLNRMSQHPKIKPQHLDRTIIDYLRQSTFKQVRENTESTRSQYALADRAQQLGWTPDKILVIDWDLGKSGRSTDNRQGFLRMLQMIEDDLVGAIILAETSRASRSSADWAYLVEKCRQHDVLIIDRDEVYDPGNAADRLTLGIKGEINQYELAVMTQRMHEKLRQKAARGEVCLHLPAGYVYDDEDAIQFDPDAQVQAVIRLFFDKFDEIRTGTGVVRYFAEHDLRFPTRLYNTVGKPPPPLRWVPLTVQRAINMLHNPTYAGVYTYGRHTRDAQGRSTKLDMDTWAVMLRDHHPAYISWETFLCNQEIIGQNRRYSKGTRPLQHSGPAREGAALLQGIAFCGCCGNRMGVQYTTPEKPAYVCASIDSTTGRDRCPSTMAGPIDAGISELVLQALTPAHLAASVAAQSQIDQHFQELTRTWAQRRAQAREVADIARRRYHNVDPENRQVAAELEADWNAALVAVAQLEHDSKNAQAEALQPLTGTERERVAALANDLPALWHADATTHTQRKQILRLIVRDVTLHIGDDDTRAVVRWVNDALSEIIAPRPLTAYELNRTDPAVMQRIRDLAPIMHDTRLADQLNAEGFKPSIAETFTFGIVNSLRHEHGIPTGCPTVPGKDMRGPRGDGRYSIVAAAALLGRCRQTVYKWCQAGYIDAIRDFPGSPYWIALSPDEIHRLQSCLKHRYRRAR